MPDLAGPLPLGATIGILGGGQLGRMLALAAARLGFRTHVYCPDDDSPAFRVTDRHTHAAYADRPALEAFAHTVDVVTFEFENVPAATAEILSGIVAVAPDPRILAVTQDRLTEKSFIRQAGLPVADFAPVADRRELEQAAARIGRPAVLKTRRLGYDGKGQVRLDAAADLDTAWTAIGGAPAIVETFVPFASEVSVILARGRDGTMAAYDIVENVHGDHVLRTSRVPAAVSPATAAEAGRIGTVLAEAFGYVGVMAVELFVLRDGGREGLVVNEIAPRVHNSGHWTETACHVSQFEMHVRAVAGWPLPLPLRFCDVEMDNLIGNDVNGAFDRAAEPATSLHVYGKRDARPGRKMGHVTRLKPRKDSPF
jgi:5-(carboxyamino)imidazole ribonucleotide synthase